MNQAFQPGQLFRMPRRRKRRIPIKPTFRPGRLFRRPRRNRQRRIPMKPAFRPGRLFRRLSRQGQRRIPIKPAFRLGRLFQHHGIPLSVSRNDRPVKQPEHQLRIRLVPKGHADPLRPLHPDRRSQIRRAAFVQRPDPALQVTALDFLAGICVPLPHQQRNPFSGPRMAKNGKAGKAVPLALLLDLIGLSRIVGQLRQFHPLTSSRRGTIGTVLFVPFSEGIKKTVPQLLLFPL